MSGADAASIYLLAGEPSGDNLGGRIMHALKQRSAVPLQFAGVGGDRMIAEGLRGLVPIGELSVMGLVEIVPHIPRLFRIAQRLAADICARRPAIVLTIDSPAFNFGVVKRAQGAREAGTKLVHLNAPKVWAYRPGRVHRVARLYDHLLCLLPFEPPYFHRVGMSASFIGHPVIESGADRGDAARFCARHGLAVDTPLLCVLPGSRGNEIAHMIPIFGATVARVAAQAPGLRIVVPTVAAMQARVREGVAAWRPAPIVIVDEAEKFDAFAASTAALAASGTVSLELNLARVPTVIAYHLAEISARIVRALARVRHVTIANLVLGDRNVVPEFLQWTCTPELLAPAVLKLLTDPAARESQVRQTSEATRMLGLGGPPPSLRAADILLAIAGIARKGA